MMQMAHEPLAVTSGKNSPAAKSDAGEDDEYVKALIRAELGTLA